MRLRTPLHHCAASLLACAFTLPALAGRPVYLAMAMNADNVLKLKPQNLLLNLPLSRPQ